MRICQGVVFKLYHKPEVMNYFILSSLKNHIIVNNRYGGLYIKPNLQRHLFMLMFLQKNDLPAEIILIPLLLILSITYKT